jgi:hypothetical protein
MAWHGIPKRQRSQVWKLLLGYTPSVQQKCEEILVLKREEYWSMVERYLSDEVRRDDETFHQVSIDVPRTCPDETLFKEPRVRECLLRILYCCSLRRPASGYVQGMNDLVTPFVDVFLRDFTALDGSSIELTEQQFYKVEADIFWCFGKLLDTTQENYTFNQAGLHRQIRILREIILRADGTNPKTQINRDESGPGKALGSNRCRLYPIFV